MGVDNEGNGYVKDWRVILEGMEVKTKVFIDKREFWFDKELLCIVSFDHNVR